MILKCPSMNKRYHYNFTRSVSIGNQIFNKFSELIILLNQVICYFTSFNVSIQSFDHLFTINFNIYVNQYSSLLSRNVPNKITLSILKNLFVFTCFLRFLLAIRFSLLKISDMSRKVPISIALAISEYSCYYLCRFSFLSLGTH